MKAKQHKLTEHYLVPAVLFLLNICLVHVIHALTEGAEHSPTYKIAIVTAFVFLASSLVARKKVYMTGSILFYALVALGW